MQLLLIEEKSLTEAKLINFTLSGYRETDAARESGRDRITEGRIGVKEIYTK